jgi:hypothetical protein
MSNIVAFPNHLRDVGPHLPGRSLIVVAPAALPDQGWTTWASMPGEDRLLFAGPDGGLVYGAARQLARDRRMPLRVREDFEPRDGWQSAACFRRVTGGDAA